MAHLMRIDHKEMSWFKLDDTDFGLLEMAIRLLEPFSVVQKVLEGSLYSTSSSTPLFLTALARSLYSILDSCRDTSLDLNFGPGVDLPISPALAQQLAPVVRALLDRLLLRFSHYIDVRTDAENQEWMVNRKLVDKNRILVYGKKHFLMATQLDPRYSALKICPWCIKEPLKTGLVELVVQEMEKEDARLQAESTATPHCFLPVFVGRSPSATRNAAIDSELMEMIGGETDVTGAVPDDRPAVDFVSLHRLRLARSCDEISRFREQAQLFPVFASSKDVLSFYKERGSAFPTVCRLARAYHAMQASSAATERLFSNGGNTVTGDRFALGDELVSSIVFSHGSIDQVCESDSRGKPVVLPTTTGSAIGSRGPQPRISSNKRLRNENGAFEVVSLVD
jgi:hypothetical protein